MVGEPVLDNEDKLRAALLAALAVRRWVDEVMASWPFDQAESLAAAAMCAFPLTWSEIETALASHPRIGEISENAGLAAEFSRHEQAANSDPDDLLHRRIVEMNRRYEEKFGHVFLIRAAGRSAEEILAEGDRRLGNDEDAERAEISRELAAITMLRVFELEERLVTPVKTEAKSMAGLSTHVLDAVRGIPAQGVAVRLDDQHGAEIAMGTTDADGRVAEVAADLAPGQYRLVFATGDYFASFGAPTLYPEVSIDFRINGSRPHYHIPLLLSPFAYSTYQGS